MSQSLVSGDAGSDSISFNGLVSNSTLTGANDADTVIFSANADLVSLDGSFGSNTSIIGGSGADTLVFINGGNVGAATIRGGVGTTRWSSLETWSLVFLLEMQALTSLPAASLLVLPELASGVDLVLTPLTSLISPTGTTGGTAYFWNEEGTDSIKFADGIGFGTFNDNVSTYNGVEFGVDTDAVNISFGYGQTTSIFGTNDGSTGFYIGASGNTLVSFGFGSTRSLSGLVVHKLLFRVVVLKKRLVRSSSLMQLSVQVVQPTSVVLLLFLPSADLFLTSQSSPLGELFFSLILVTKPGYLCLAFPSLFGQNLFTQVTVFAPRYNFFLLTTLTILLA